MAPLADAGSVREAFDRIAPEFDSVVRRNGINEWMHDVNMAKVLATFPPGARLVELGCGTGTDAIALAKRGCTVFALDLSPQMVAHARTKVAAAGLDGHVAVATGRSRDLLQLLPQSPWQRFDGGYANFSLTYEEDLEGIARDLGAILEPGASFLCTIPNRIVLSEVAIYGPLLRFRQVLWRFARPLWKDVHGFRVIIHARSPWEVVKAFRADFKLREMVGVPTFLPPVYLHKHYERLGGGRRLLQGLDRRLAGRFPWNRLGEHTLFKFQKLER